MRVLNTATVAALLMAIAACSPGTETTEIAATESAAAPAASADVYPFRIGTLEAMSLREGGMQVPNDNTTLAVGRTQEETAALLVAAGLSGETLDLSIQPLLVRTGDRVVLFDAGAGSAMGANAGKLPASLRSAGIEPSAITDIMISHGHPDHVAGLAGADGALTFPNATIHISAPEWAAIQADAQLADLVTAITPKVTPFQPGATLAPGVTAVAIDGHTPGHSGFEIISGEDRLLYIGDAMHHQVISVQRPDWRIQFDGDSPTANASRRALLERAAAENLHLYAVHFPFPGVGRVRKEGETFVWVPDAPAT